MRPTFLLLSVELKLGQKAKDWPGLPRPSFVPPRRCGLYCSWILCSSDRCQLRLPAIIQCTHPRSFSAPLNQSIETQ